MGHKGSRLCLKEPATGPCHLSDESNQQPDIQFLQDTVFNPPTEPSSPFQVLRLNMHLSSLLYVLRHCPTPWVMHKAIYVYRRFVARQPQIIYTV
jgi:hypothetical protein